MKKYEDFLKELDARLGAYFKAHSEHLFCKKGCSACCANGDYPLSELELKYLMQGFLLLENEMKILVQKNFNKIQKGGKCPFLINSECSIYPYRPIICRTHGLAYLCKDKTAKLPYCVNEGLNYAKVYANNEIFVEPVSENLDTQELLKDFDFGEVRNLYDWLNK